MDRRELVWLGLAFAALAAVVIYQRPIAAAVVTAADGSPVDFIGNSLTPNNDSVTRGMAYMTYNAPWFFAPPIGNFLPSITAGQGSQTVNVPTDFDNGCGCG